MHEMTKLRNTGKNSGSACPKVCDLGLQMNSVGTGQLRIRDKLAKRLSRGHTFGQLDKFLNGWTNFYARWTNLKPIDKLLGRWTNYKKTEVLIWTPKGVRLGFDCGLKKVPS